MIAAASVMLHKRACTRASMRACVRAIMHTNELIVIYMCNFVCAFRIIK